MKESRLFLDKKAVYKIQKIFMQILDKKYFKYYPIPKLK